MNSITINKAPLKNRHYSRLSLFLSNSSDEKLIRQLLSSEFNISSKGEFFKSGNFDLIISDVSSLRKLAIDFEVIKHQACPVVLPILLLVKKSSAIKEISEYSEIVDDIVYVPTSPDILRSRVKLLLKTRNYSKQLEREKRKYQLLANNSTDMISIHRPNGEYEYVSPSSINILGYKPIELIGRNAFDFIHEDDHEAVSISREYTLRTGEPSKIEFRKKTKSGENRWVESILKTLEVSSDPGAVQIQASTRDISDRKRYENKLLKEVSFSNASLDALPEIFFMIDSDLNLVRWNLNLEDHLGYSRREIMTMKPVDFFEEKDHQEVNEKIQEVLLTGEAQMETELIAKNGDLIRHRISGRLFVDEDKRFIIGTCVDASRDFKMMNELKASNNEKEVLLLEIHHRVKNNLATISGMLQLQAMESDDPVLCEKLRDSHLRMQSIASVHEMLYQSESFTHLDMKIYLNKLLGNILDSKDTHKNNISLVDNITSVVLNINQAIPCSLIANELITNSYKHAFKDNDCGEVSVILLESSDGDVQLIVEDNGGGLPEDLDVFQSNSLGLQLVNALKEQLNAKLDVSKPKESGVRFSLTFKKKEIKGSANGHL